MNNPRQRRLRIALLLAAVMLVPTRAFAATGLEVRTSVDFPGVQTWTVNAGATSRVTVSTTTSFDGVSSARFVPTANLTATTDDVSFTPGAAGTLSFIWRGDSNNSSNTLGVYLSGVVHTVIAGTTGWSYAEVPIPSGATVVGFRAKSGATSLGGGYLDRVRFTIAGAPIISREPVTISGARDELQGSPVAVDEGLKRFHAVQFVGDGLRLESIVSTSDGAQTYKWYRNNVAIAGQTSRDLSIPAATTADNGTYAVEATWGGQTTRSRDAAVTMLDFTNFRAGSGLGAGTWRSTPANPWTRQNSATATSTFRLESPIAATTALARTAVAVGLVEGGKYQFDIGTPTLPANSALVLTINGRWARAWSAGQLSRNEEIFVPTNAATLRWEIVTDATSIPAGAVWLENLRRTSDVGPVFESAARTVVVPSGAGGARIGGEAVGQGTLLYNWSLTSGTGYYSTNDIYQPFLTVVVSSGTAVFTLTATDSAQRKSTSTFTVQAVASVPITLAPGDVAVSRYRSDEVSILAMRDIPAGTSLIFSGSGGSTVQTVDTLLAKGSSRAFKVGPVQQLKFGGEFFVSQGTASDPRFIYAAHFDPEWGIWANPPPGLEIGRTAISIGALESPSGEVDVAFKNSASGLSPKDTLDLLGTRQPIAEVVGAPGSVDWFAQMGWIHPQWVHSPWDQRSISIAAAAGEIVVLDEGIFVDNAPTVVPVRVMRRYGTSGVLAATAATLTTNTTPSGATVTASAIPVRDYTAVSQSLSWANGESGFKQVDVSVNAVPYQTRRAFTLDLGGAGAAGKSTRIDLVGGGTRGEAPDPYPSVLSFEYINYTPVFTAGTALPTSLNLNFDVVNLSTRASAAGQARVIGPNGVVVTMTMTAISPGGYWYPSAANETQMVFPAATNESARFATIELWENGPGAGELTLVSRQRVQARYVAATGTPASGGVPLIAAVRQARVPAVPPITSVEIEEPIEVAAGTSTPLRFVANPYGGSTSMPLFATWIPPNPATGIALSSDGVLTLGTNAINTSPPITAYAAVPSLFAMQTDSLGVALSPNSDSAKVTVVLPQAVQNAADYFDNSWKRLDSGDLVGATAPGLAYDGVSALSFAGSTPGSGGGLTLDVNGPGTLVFWWRGTLFATNTFSVFIGSETTPRFKRSAGDSDWQRVVIPITNYGTTKVRWSGGLIEPGQPFNNNYGFLDRVAFYPDYYPTMLQGPIAAPNLRNELQGSAFAPEWDATRLNGTLFAGDDADLNAIFDQPENLTFQWYRHLNGSGVIDTPAGGTTPTLHLANLSTADNGTYYVAARNGNGAETSSELILRVVDLSSFKTASGLGSGIWRTTPEAIPDPDVGTINLGWAARTVSGATRVASPALNGSSTVASSSAVAVTLSGAGDLEFDLSTAALPAGASLILTENGRWIKTWTGPGSATAKRERIRLATAKPTVRWELAAKTSVPINAATISGLKFFKYAGPAFERTDKILEGTVAVTPVGAFSTDVPITGVIGQPLRIGANAAGRGTVNYAWFEDIAGTLTPLTGATAFRTVTPGATARRFVLNATDLDGTTGGPAFVVTGVAGAAPTLRPGDLTIERYRRDTIAVRALRTSSISTQFIVTDSSWNPVLGWVARPEQKGETFRVITLPAMTAGQIFEIPLAPALDLDLDDELHLFQGTVDYPAFLFSAHFFGDWAHWGGLPDGLKIGESAVGFGPISIHSPEIDLAFARTTIASPADLRAKLDSRPSDRYMPVKAGLVEPFLVTEWNEPQFQLDPLAATSLSLTPERADPAADQGTAVVAMEDAIVLENIGQVVVPVARRYGTKGALSVTVATANGTATSGIDFTGSSSLITWADGASDTRLVTIPIKSVAGTGTRRFFKVNVLTSPGAVALDTCRIDILDVDNPAGTSVQLPHALIAEEISYTKQPAQSQTVQYFTLTFKVRNLSSTTSLPGIVQVQAAPDASASTISLPAIPAGGSTFVNGGDFGAGAGQDVIAKYRDVTITISEDLPDTANRIVVGRWYARAEFTLNPSRPPSQNSSGGQDVKKDLFQIGFESVVKRIALTPPAALMPGATPQTVVVQATYSSGAVKPTTSVDWPTTSNTYTVSSAGEVDVPSGAAATAQLSARFNDTTLLPQDSAGPLLVTASVEVAVLTEQPIDKTVGLGETATFRVAATLGGLAFQWQRAAAGTNTWSPIAASATDAAGAWSERSVTPASGAENGDKFRCVISQTGRTDVTTAAATLTVNTKTQQTIIFAPPAARTYGDAAFAVSATASSGLPVTISLVGGPATFAANTVTITGAGSIVLRATQAGDSAYDAATDVEKTITVAKVPLTARADDRTKFFGDANPALTISYTGFVLGENESVIGTKPTAATSATTGSAIGAYPITLSGGVDNNYTITLTNGTLTIAPKIVPVQTGLIAVPPGGTVVLSVTVTNTGGASPSFQWEKLAGGAGGGAEVWVPVTGANAATYTIPNSQSADSGTYRVAVTVGTVASYSSNFTVSVGSSRVVNLSVRTGAGTGDQTLIVGLVVGGSGTGEILIRGIGPTLGDFGVAGVLADPQLLLYSSPANVLLQQNDDWGGGATLTNAFASVFAFALPPSAKDAALLPDLAFGSYTAQCTSTSGTGIALVELYDTQPAGTARLINVSARTQVGTGDGILIAGFVIDGTTSKTLLIRAIGPTLGAFGVGGVLANPQLALYSGSSVVEQNDDWGGGTALTNAFATVFAFALPAGSKDAALLVTLAPGSYTAQVSGVGATTGVALVEVYEMP